MATATIPTVQRRSAKSVAPQIVVAAAFAPAVVAYFARLSSLEHYQFFPFALAGAALLARRAWKEPFVASPTSRGHWIAATLSALGLLAASIILQSPWAGYAGSLVMLTAWLYGVGGRANVARFLPAIVMLLTVLRPPLSLDARLIASLQTVTAQLAALTLDVFNVIHVRAGNVIEIPGRRLFVEEACSGVNSLFSALACTIFYLLWSRRHAFVAGVMLLCVPLWVVAANAGRIAIVAWLRSRWDVAADEGLLHDALGLVVFAVAMLLILSTERLLTFYAAVIPPHPEADEQTAATAASLPTLDPSPTRSLPWLIPAAAAGLLLVLQLPSLAREVRELSPGDVDQLADFGDAFLPEQSGEWKRAKHELIERRRSSAFGEYSQVWFYENRQDRLTASLDYPFVGWHELPECYAAQGWTIASRSIVAATIAVSAGEAAPTTVYVRMRHAASGRYGRLWFTILAADGTPVAPRRHGEWDELADRIAARWRSLTMTSAAAEFDRTAQTYQVQVFLESFEPPNSADDDAPPLFEPFVRQVRERLATFVP